MANGSLPKRYPVLTFLILAYLLVTPILAASQLNIPFPLLVIIGSWTPNIAAFIVLGLVLREKGGIRKLISRWGLWRTGVKWYLAAFSPAVIALAAWGFYLLSGGKSSPPSGSVSDSVLMGFVVALITGATGEELGWRGFLLPRLQARFSPLMATFIVGGAWALWHLPLWFIPGSVWQESIPYSAFALAMISSSFLYTWVVNNTGGSMLMALIIHFTWNFVGNITVNLGWVPLREFYNISAVLFAVYAGLIILVTRPAMGRTGAAFIPASEPGGAPSGMAD